MTDENTNSGKGNINNLKGFLGEKKIIDYVVSVVLVALGVFLGTFVQTRVQESVEHRTEKQYMESMMIDLQMDTVSMNRWLRETEKGQKDIETSLMLISTEN